MSKVKGAMVMAVLSHFRRAYDEGREVEAWEERLGKYWGRFSRLMRGMR